MENKTKEQLYEEMRKKIAQKYKEKENLKRGINNAGGAANLDEQLEDMDALERMNLDQRNEDPALYDQFNPMAIKAETGLSLKAQNQRMGKDTTKRFNIH
jgi:hypothetical protein